MLAVFSVVISISGSVKYSDATHLPFSGPKRGRNEGWDIIFAYGNEKTSPKQTKQKLQLKNTVKGQTGRARLSSRGAEQNSNFENIPSNR